jgi:hypothetical protein
MAVLATCSKVSRIDMIFSEACKKILQRFWRPKEQNNLKTSSEHTKSTDLKSESQKYHFISGETVTLLILST